MQQAIPKHRHWSIFLSACMLLASGCLAEGQAPGTEPWLAGASGSDLAEAEQPLKKTGLCPVPGTLGYHLTQSNQKNPSVIEFHYNPPGEVAGLVDGSYNRKTHTFSFTESYHPQHYRTEATVQGTVIPAPTGTAVSYTVATTDKNGGASTEQVEETWVGCAVTRRTRPLGAPDSAWRYHHGNYADGAYSYDDQQAPNLWYEDPDDPGIPYANGTLVTSDMSWIESFSGYWVSEEFSYGHTRKGDADGYVVTHWARAGGDYEQSGTDELFLDGTVKRVFHMDSADDSADVQVIVDYDGNGSGSLETMAYDPNTDDWTPVTCTLLLTAETCTETCANISKSCPWWITK